jgi:hypothetical protein
VIGAVTAGAAGLAAVLAAINLYVSGRRELNKWTREALIETFVTFLDASFRQNRACRTLASGVSPTEEDRTRLHRAVVAAHDLQTDTLTRLRLLAPSRVVTAAEALHEAEHKLASVCIAEPRRSAEELEDARVPVRRARAHLLESARSTLRLRDTAAIGHHHHDAGWHEFRAITVPPLDGDPIPALQPPPEDAAPGSQ